MNIKKSARAEFTIKKIEDALSITIKDMNSVTISGEQSSAKDIVDSANMYPFGDANRLVVVKNFAPIKDKQAFETIQTYLNAPLDSTIFEYIKLFISGMPRGSTCLELFKAISKFEPH